MYSDKNISRLLTAMLIAKGVREAVVCPGSRNIPIVSDLEVAPGVRCHPVTDERSAAFYALGLSLAKNEPVVVCVTSGSALLNASPAIAEAYYRHVPLILVSADRPEEWIDRLDGQTMRQYGALEKIVTAQVDLRDYTDDDLAAENYATLLLNRTLVKAIDSAQQGPAHINVQLSEPLFGSSHSSLPKPRVVETLRLAGDTVSDDARLLASRFAKAECKILVIGQLPCQSDSVDKLIAQLSKTYLILCELLASRNAMPFDKAVDYVEADTEVQKIDFAVTMGGTIVSKKLRKYLRRCDIAEHWEVNPDSEIHDISGQQTGILRCQPETFLKALLEETQADLDSMTLDPLRSKWLEKTGIVSRSIEDYEPPYSAMSAVREFELSLEDMEYTFHVHYANSMPVRLACLYAQHYVWCNRGLNGIDGSISTAAGFAAANMEEMVFCVTGDLSFFYDQNALWNQNLGGNFRILLLNNSGGGIFQTLPGLKPTPQTNKAICGIHQTTARGICEQNDIGYIQARNAEEYRNGLAHLLTETTHRPMVLEVFNAVQQDTAAIQELEEIIKRNNITC